MESRIEDLGAPLRYILGWKARRVRTRAHLMLRNHPAAVDTFRSAYEAYTPLNLPVMHWILKIAVDLVGSGVAAHEIVEIMAGDKAKAYEFAPLVAALRQLAGDEFAPSTEVLEVAADVRDCIESR